jgi:2-phosphoglycerate kinase
MQNVILIGGAAGSGKSTLAKQLAKHFQLPWLSTDQIRRILQTTEQDEEKKAELIWSATSALLKGIHPWEGGIIEGTAILPRFLAKDFSELPIVKPIFLIQSETEISRIIEERSKLPFINTKTPEQQVEKVSKVKKLNDEIQKEAQLYGYPCINAHLENTFEESLKATGLK